ncbi:ankyrin repeat-containing domain, PGG domain protein [Artemisia annua]|uniref:Ankyrin repeat-containing domain, PGG domain protein n=1 Tax=Artemisia annua TaxID=35608 RepID=A0A2U1PAE9_ARTAN|nr:ankyrin repeat-containing domain, PGG domain protein [Artemisia annua]
MANVASTSNPSCIVDVGEAFPYRSHVIGPNIVTVKLSGKSKYNLWKIQMECLLESQHMVGFIKGHFPSPTENGKEKVGDKEVWIAVDSLVKGWILGSLSEEAAGKAVNRLTHKQNNTYFSAKDLWDELQRSYGPSVREQASETKLTTRQTESKDEPTEEKKIEISVRELKKRKIYNAVLEGNTYDMIGTLEYYGLNPWDELTHNGNTVLHVAVGSSTKNHKLLKELLGMTPKEKLLDIINSDGSSPLHVVAIGDNIEAVNLLVERNPELLLAKDNEGHTPLALSVSNMHTKTSRCLFEHMKEKGYGSYFSGQSGEEIVVIAISCQDFSLANRMINDYPDAILPNSEALLTALAQNFPRELNSWERRGFCKELGRTLKPYEATYDRLEEYFDWECGRQLFNTCCLSFSGAALQIQRELQWFKEVERFVCPLNRIQKNSDDETPEMVFTREHKDLVIEGENWIKKTAESYTITAALIITIVFAAAITVPGGNNQESGIPIFTNNIAFTVFAISDAISLFTAVTSLLMFLSILTARFAEQDFLFKLPTKLIIGLTMLFLSTTAMIIAFGATLFLVFGQRNLLMLIPIGALTCLPITSFVTLQFPLIMELISATYCGRIFVKEKYDYFY